MEGSRSGRGRPRKFDEDNVVDAAIEVFSSKGFTAASLSELTKATGLSVSSLYKAFGDKDGVFQQAIARYVSLGDQAMAVAAATDETARQKLVAIVEIYAGWSQGISGRRGCLVISGLAEIDILGKATARHLRDALNRRRAVLCGLIEEGQRDGSIGSREQSAVLADLLLTIVQGMRVVGKSGLFPVDPRPLIVVAMRILD
ncbi:TetR/AcrR family transcriptional regulator [Glacieibacterium megasporae]|uniref:TetR/AcrR family transcriptional regulator n=1 Tax=Glacieibacterium megasporae TaxID=2835787 RepID=UPI001C1E0CA9|nr:TetR/AcrR family transcriptional regulator [Polymorphobacter megasporae]UAJ10583.1 TetR/AcrR family transcriptional regulator [Polymorphobacter megasporae]